MNMTMKTNALPSLRAALLVMCTAAIGAAPLTLLAQTPDTPPASQQGPPPDGARPGRGGPGGRGAGMGSQQIEMMTRELNLTPDQVTKLKALGESSRTRMMALRDDTSTPQEEKRTKMMAMREEQQTKIKALLTDDQKPKYDAMVARMRANRPDGAGGPPPTPATPPQL